MEFKRSFFRSHSRGGEVDPEDIFLDSMNPVEFDQERLEGRLEHALPGAPFRFGWFLIFLGMAVLLSRAGYLQIVEGSVLEGRAEENRIFGVTLPAPRGIIYDRYHEALVKNTPSFEVVLEKNQLPDDIGGRGRLAANLSLLLGKSAAELIESGFDYKKEKKALPAEIVAASDISREQVVDFESRREDFPGAIIRERELRHYPGEAFAHLIGYVRKVTDADLKDYPEYSLADFVGKSGLEAQYESELKGKDGERLIEVNASHVEVGDLPERSAEIGNGLLLNIDADLQRVLHDSLAKYIAERGKVAGAGVIMDPRDGAIRALVSLPAFDPNVFRKRLSQEDFEKIFLPKSKPLFNRVISAVYPAGSVVKPMVGVASLEEKILDPNYQIYDSGSIAIPNPYRPGEETVFPDWRAHGTINLRSAIQWSANVYFYIVGGGYRDIKGLGITKLGEWMRRFGLGSRLGIDLPGEAEGLVPGPDNVAKTRPNDPVWRLGDTYHASIGQGSFQASPLQIAAMTAAIANGGTLWQPQVVRAVLDEKGNVISTAAPKALRENIAKSESFKIVQEGMRLVATEGTARNFFAEFPVEVAGKTGTAQTGFYKTAHGWFAAFAPYRNPELVTVIMAEDIGENTSIATPVTRDVLYWYFTEGKRRTAY